MFKCSQKKSAKRKRMYFFPETREKHNRQLYDSVTETCHNEVGRIVTFCKTQPLKKKFSDTGRTLKTQS